MQSSSVAVCLTCSTKLSSEMAQATMLTYAPFPSSPNLLNSSHFGSATRHANPVQSSIAALSLVLFILQGGSGTVPIGASLPKSTGYRQVQTTVDRAPYTNVKCRSPGLLHLSGDHDGNCQLEREFNSSSSRTCHNLAESAPTGRTFATGVEGDSISCRRVQEAWIRERCCDTESL